MEIILKSNSSQIFNVAFARIHPQTDLAICLTHEIVAQL